jgi:molybdenum cofactor guanylyltransferase
MSDTTDRRLTGLVLAGGTSRRMGRDKTRLRVGGEPLVSRVARRLAPMCERVFVVSRDGSSYTDLGLEEIADPPGHSGPLAGIVAGLEAAGTPLAVVVAADMPEVDVEVLAVLRDEWKGEPAVVPVVAERIQPLHGVYATRWAPELRRALEAGRRGVVAALSDVGARVVGSEAWGHLDDAGRFATDLDLPTDLAGYEEAG